MKLEVNIINDSAKLIVSLVIIFYFFWFFVFFFYRKYSQTIVKFLLQYIFISLFVILVFSISYFFFSVSDVANILKAADTETVSKKIMYENEIYIRNLDYLALEGDKLKYAIKYLEISTLNYFGIENNIKFFYEAQIIQILQKVLSYFVPIIIIIVGITKGFRTKGNEELLIFLNLGWMILSIEKSTNFKKKYDITLISDKGKTKVIQVDNIIEIKNLIKLFKYNWVDVTLETVPIFAKSLVNILRGEDSNLAVEAYKFTSHHYLSKDTQNYCTSYYNFLLEAKYTLSVMESDITFDDFDHVFKVLKKNIQDISQLNDHLKIEVTD